LLAEEVILYHVGNSILSSLLMTSMSYIVKKNTSGW